MDNLSNIIIENRVFEIEELISKFEMTGAVNEIARFTKRERYEAIKDAFSLFAELERLREEWTDELEKVKEILYTNDYENYAAISETFDIEFVEMFGREDWDIFSEQILMFFIYTYFCGAVYDNCVFSKVALAAYSVCFIREFIMCNWYTNGRKMDLDECIRLAYRYAREVEHSDVNLQCMEEWFMERYDAEK